MFVVGQAGLRDSRSWISGRMIILQPSSAQVIETAIGSPLSVAPPPAEAAKSSSVIGLNNTPTTGRASLSWAMATQK
jgi:hypothetical protein